MEFGLSPLVHYDPTSGGELPVRDQGPRRAEVGPKLQRRSRDNLPRRDREARPANVKVQVLPNVDIRKETGSIEGQRASWPDIQNIGANRASHRAAEGDELSKVILARRPRAVDIPVVPV